jgi:hypothetical protein
VDDWDFYQHTDGQWSWSRRTTAGTRYSAERFESFIGAVGNALLHGFEPGISKIAAVTLERRNKTR